MYIYFALYASDCMLYMYLYLYNIETLDAEYYVKYTFQKALFTIFNANEFCNISFIIFLSKTLLFNYKITVNYLLQKHFLSINNFVIISSLNTPIYFARVRIVEPSKKILKLFLSSKYFP